MIDIQPTQHHSLCYLTKAGLSLHLRSWLASAGTMQRSLASKARTSVLPPLSNTGSLSRIRLAPAAGLSLQQQRYAHKVIKLFRCLVCIPWLTGTAGPQIWCRRKSGSAQRCRHSFQSRRNHAWAQRTERSHRVELWVTKDNQRYVVTLRPR